VHDMLPAVGFTATITQAKRNDNTNPWPLVPTDDGRDWFNSCL
jgi:hypothetical protein